MHFMVSPDNMMAPLWSLGELWPVTVILVIIPEFAKFYADAAEHHETSVVRIRSVSRVTSLSQAYELI
jgi:hypothetical protein